MAAHARLARELADALDAGRRAVLHAADCTVCLATLPVLAARRPDARVAWLDAHPDFNSPETSPSGWLGGMCLAGACGVWDAGLDGPALDPGRVHLMGIRDVDPGEAELLARFGVRRDPPPDGAAVLVHLDLDVLRNDLHPAAYPSPGGWTWAQLRAALTDLAARCEVLAVEVAGAAPGCEQRVADTLAALS